jgi:hypothetical protein
VAEHAAGYVWFDVSIEKDELGVVGRIMCDGVVALFDHTKLSDAVSGL